MTIKARIQVHSLDLIYFNVIMNDHSTLINGMQMNRDQMMDTRDKPKILKKCSEELKRSISNRKTRQWSDQKAIVSKR